MFYTANQGPLSPTQRQKLNTGMAAVHGAVYSVNQGVSISGTCSGYSIMTRQNSSCYNPYNGIKTLKENNTFAIYPNPTRGTFTIETTVNEYTLVITNILGQRVLSREIQNQKSIINLSIEANGMYFIQEQYKNGIATQKLIIQK